MVASVPSYVHSFLVIRKSRFERMAAPTFTNYMFLQKKSAMVVIVARYGSWSSGVYLDRVMICALSIFQFSRAKMMQ